MSMIEFENKKKIEKKSMKNKSSGVETNVNS